MLYIFRGRLCGLICAECPEPLSSVRVRLYRNRSDQKVTALAVASPKETLGLVSADEIEKKSKFLLTCSDAFNPLHHFFSRIF